MGRMGRIVVFALLLALLVGCSNTKPYAKYAVSSDESNSAYSLFAALDEERVKSVSVHYGYVYDPCNLDEQNQASFVQLLLDTEVTSTQGIDVNRYITENSIAGNCDDFWAVVTLNSGEAVQVMVSEPFLMINGIGFESDSDDLKELNRFIHSFQSAIMPNDVADET